MKTWLALLFVGLTAGTWNWPKSVPAAGAAQGNPSVQMVRPGQKRLGNPGEKGALYYTLEGQTTRLTTKFKSGEVAVTERGRTGNVTTTLRDVGGNEVARLKVNRVDGGHDLVHYEPSDAAPFQATSDPNLVKPTLDWSAKQTYHLKKGGSDNLVWDQGMMRSSKTATIDVESEVAEVETEWADGLTATVTHQVYARRQISPGRFAGGPVLVSDLRLHGAHVGTAVWFEKDRVYAYYIPQLMPSGMTVVFESDLSQLYGGWPVTPDTTWINLQLIASHHLRALVAKNGFAAKNCNDAPRTQLSRLTEFFVPKLMANEPGCDDHHYWDGGVLRVCCDDHDACYAKSGCTQSSWWTWWTSWVCTQCNLQVVFCFVVQSTADPACINQKACAG